MSRRCEVTGVGVQYGNKVSHSNHKTSKRFLPNLQKVTMLSDVLEMPVKLRLTVATIRTIEHNGGLDAYLLSTSNLKLTELARKLKRKIEKKLDEKKAA